ncbi:hypothetical protein B0I73DRAFT_1164 [Yarrowia lipolytica]|uniref:Uncharacterized protein n=1 Tax=Yarrowia lipolytica TaxID=4952 RepID=A0A371C8W9_YARLL|nr:Hypothetical protein YALI2_F00189g [Yarrowia lipolytica]RDW26744.1 hypothetical protein B0I71DRAFT_164141 [Yarrowia lipolytica]RDW42775.1 hypothetical protein B0I73DRAFT_1164 [Yarrowia lipolytica]RDW46162.1 hypothetical protein B0I74DRAFT_152427 [Yarrowia lipolytica]RDW55335.1 hypothetical protein B0I75DRAFT_98426 [Yarrowia lipolytica]
MIPRQPPPAGPLGTDFDYSVAGVAGVLVALGAPWPMGQIAEVLSDKQLGLAFFTMFLHVMYVGGLVTEACFPANFVTTAIKIPKPVFLATKVVYIAFASWEFSGHGDMSLYLVGILLATLVLTELGAALKANKHTAQDKKTQ